MEAERIVEWFVLRWQLEVTFEEVRAQLGIEMQWLWAELAILRTTPLPSSLFPAPISLQRLKRTLRLRQSFLRGVVAKIENSLKITNRERSFPLLRVNIPA